MSTDWAPGSSGSAVLDDCGNAIGHVVNISSTRDETAPKAQDAQTEKPAATVFHAAVSARDVLLLTRPRKWGAMGWRPRIAAFLYFLAHILNSGC